MLLVFMLSIKLFCFSLFFLGKKKICKVACAISVSKNLKRMIFIYIIIRKVTSFHLEEWKSDAKEKNLE